MLTESDASCVVYGMPRAVKEAGLSAAEAPLEQMATELGNRVIFNATERLQRRTERFIERRVWALHPGKRPTSCCRARGRVPQVAHLEHFAEGFDEGCQQVHCEPRKTPNARVWRASSATRRFRDFHAALEPVACKMELSGMRRALQSRATRRAMVLGQIGQIRPGVADFPLARVE